jgi:outer membrane receptor protein involved in Fe transport
LRLLVYFGVSLPALISAAAANAQSAPAPDDSAEIVVTARRLDKARDEIQPSLGASEFKFSRAVLDNQPQGGDRNLTQVLLQAPGVTQDGNGSIHVRNEHGNLQYRLNGIIVPESISGFGQTFDPRVADSIELITGTLPAQYGYRTSGVVSLKTRGGTFDNGGEIGYYGGSHNNIQPSVTLHGATKTLNYFVSGSFLQNDLGVENHLPTRNAVHDRTRQYRAFGYVSDILSDKSRLSLFGGTAIGSFQIPTSPGLIPQFAENGQSSFDSARLDQNQHEITHYGVLAYQYSGDAFNLQVAPFIRYSRTRFTPDPLGGDILFDGFADQPTLSSLAAGLQVDGSYKLSDQHSIRFGVFFQNERTRSAIISTVLPVDALGNQTSDLTRTIINTGGRNGQLYGVYLQDEWTLSKKLTLNIGVRFDAVRAFTREQQFSPRVNLVWQPLEGTTIHAGYARNFTPPPQELIGTISVASFVGTAKGTEVATADPARAERESYFDAGIEQKLAPGFTVSFDSYYKKKRNLLDDGQFGAALVQSPFNYETGSSWGVEFRADYTHGPLSLYANLARGEERARNIISSQFFFAQSDLDYIRTNSIFTDHSQRWTASGGASVTTKNRLGTLVPSADFLYGDGLRAEDPAGIIPNGGKLPSYVQVNFGVAQNFDGPGILKGVSVRCDITNLFDQSYIIRDGSGVGVGAPQYGPRRAIFFGIKKAF